MPKGRRNSEPAPAPRASGNAPKRAAIVVIMMGRNRRIAAVKIASLAGMSSMRCAATAKSIIMIAFFLTIPIRRMIPIKDMTLSSPPTIMSATRAPTPAEGRVDRIVIGWIRLS